jgi:carboxy-cis,cis-muconate cyclase
MPTTATSNPNSTLRLDRTIAFNGPCFNTTSAFIVQNSKSPNAVYVSQWPGPAACGSSLKVLSNGTLSSVLQTWTHAMGNDGKVSAVATLPMPKAGIHPRHLVAHPAGEYLYVVLEAGNAVVEYSLDEDTAAAKTQVNSYSLIPAGKLRCSLTMRCEKRTDCEI